MKRAALVSSPDQSNEMMDVIESIKKSSKHILLMTDVTSPIDYYCNYLCIAADADLAQIFKNSVSQHPLRHANLPSSETNKHARSFMKIYGSTNNIKLSSELQTTSKIIPLAELKDVVRKRATNENADNLGIDVVKSCMFAGYKVCINSKTGTPYILTDKGGAFISGKWLSEQAINFCSSLLKQRKIVKIEQQSADANFFHKRPSHKIFGAGNSERLTEDRKPIDIDQDDIEEALSNNNNTNMLSEVRDYKLKSGLNMSERAEKIVFRFISDNMQKYMADEACGQKAYQVAAIKENKIVPTYYTFSEQYASHLSPLVMIEIPKVMKLIAYEGIRVGESECQSYALKAIAKNIQEEKSQIDLFIGYRSAAILNIKEYLDDEKANMDNVKISIDNTYKIIVNTPIRNHQELKKVKEMFDRITGLAPMFSKSISADNQYSKGSLILAAQYEDRVKSVSSAGEASRSIEESKFIGKCSDLKQPIYIELSGSLFKDTNKPEFLVSCLARRYEGLCTFLKTKSILDHFLQDSILSISLCCQNGAVLDDLIWLLQGIELMLTNKYNFLNDNSAFPNNLGLSFFKLFVMLFSLEGLLKSNSVNSEHINAIYERVCEVLGCGIFSNSLAMSLNERLCGFLICLAQKYRQETRFLTNLLHTNSELPSLQECQPNNLTQQVFDQSSHTDQVITVITTPFDLIHYNSFYYSKDKSCSKWIQEFDGVSTASKANDDSKERNLTFIRGNFNNQTHQHQTFDFLESSKIIDEPMLEKVRKSDKPNPLSLIKPSTIANKSEGHFSNITLAPKDIPKKDIDIFKKFLKTLESFHDYDSLLDDAVALQNSLSHDKSWIFSIIPVLGIMGGCLACTKMSKEDRASLFAIKDLKTALVTKDGNELMLKWKKAAADITTKSQNYS